MPIREITANTSMISSREAPSFQSVMDVEPGTGRVQVRGLRVDRDVDEFLELGWKQTVFHGTVE